MADGRMSRWEATCDTPKHLVPVDGEPLLARLIRQVRQNDPEAEVIVTSHDPRYGNYGARRHEPQNNVYEIDRFTRELVQDDVCFLYGDTYYSDAAVETICRVPTDTMHFVGTKRSIIAVKVRDSRAMLEHFERIRNLHIAGKLDDCRGWQLYQSFTNLPFGDKTITDAFTLIDDETQGFNRVEEYRKFIEERKWQS